MAHLLVKKIDFDIHLQGQIKGQQIDFSKFNNFLTVSDRSLNFVGHPP